MLLTRVLLLLQEQQKHSSVVVQWWCIDHNPRSHSFADDANTLARARARTLANARTHSCTHARTHLHMLRNGGGQSAAGQLDEVGQLS